MIYNQSCTIDPKQADKYNVSDTNIVKPCDTFPGFTRYSQVVLNNGSTRERPDYYWVHYDGLTENKFHKFKWGRCGNDNIYEANYVIVWSSNYGSDPDATLSDDRIKKIEPWPGDLFIRVIHGRDTLLLLSLYYPHGRLKFKKNGCTYYNTYSVEYAPSIYTMDIKKGRRIFVCVSKQGNISLIKTYEAGLVATLPDDLDINLDDITYFDWRDSILHFANTDITVKMRPK